MKRLSFFLLTGMLLILSSCGDSSSLEELNPNENEKAFITLTGPDGKIVEKEVPKELQRENKVATSRRAPCKATVTNHYQYDWNGVSVNNQNLIVPTGGVASIGCPCTGYIWLVTSGPGRSISWTVTNNSNGSLVGSGTLPNSNGVDYEWY